MSQNTTLVSCKNAKMHKEFLPASALAKSWARPPSLPPQNACTLSIELLLSLRPIKYLQKVVYPRQTWKNPPTFDKFTFILFQNTHTISLIYTIQYLLNRNIRSFQRNHRIYTNWILKWYDFPSLLLKGGVFCSVFLLLLLTVATSGFGHKSVYVPMQHISGVVTIIITTIIVIKRALKQN